MNKAEEEHIAKVKSLSCCLCGASAPSDAHHILEGRIKGVRSGHFCTIPLCKDCHQGNINGIHGQQIMLKVMKKTELKLLDETLNRLYGGCRCGSYF